MKDLLNKLRKVLARYTLKKPGSQQLLLAIADDIVKFFPEFRLEQAAALLPTPLLTEDGYYQDQLVELNHYLGNLTLFEQLLLQFKKLLHMHPAITEEYKAYVTNYIENIINCIQAQRLTTVNSHLLCHDKVRHLIHTKAATINDVMTSVDRLMDQYRQSLTVTSLNDLIKIKREIDKQLNILREIYRYTIYQIGFYIHDETAKKALFFDHVFPNQKWLVHLEQVMLGHSAALVKLIKEQTFAIPSKDQLSDEDYVISLFQLKSRLNQYKIALANAYPVKLNIIDQFDDKDLLDQVKNNRNFIQNIKINIDVLISGIDKLNNNVNQIIKNYKISPIKLDEIKARANGVAHSLYQKIRQLDTAVKVDENKILESEKVDDYELDGTHYGKDILDYVNYSNDLHDLITRTHNQFLQLIKTLSNPENFDFVDEIVTHKTLDTIVVCADILKTLMRKLLIADNQSLSVAEIYFPLKQLLNDIRTQHAQKFQSLTEASDYLQELMVKIMVPANAEIQKIAVEVKKVINHHADIVHIALQKLFNSPDIKQIDQLNFNEMMEDIFPLLEAPEAVEYNSSLLAFPAYLGKIISIADQDKNKYAQAILQLNQDVEEILNSGDCSPEIISDIKLQINYYEKLVDFYGALVYQLRTCKTQLERSLHIMPGSLIMFGKLPAKQKETSLIATKINTESVDVEKSTNVKDVVFEEVVDHPLVNKPAESDFSENNTKNEQNKLTSTPIKIIPALLSLIKSVFGKNNETYHIYQAINDAIDNTFNVKVPVTKPSWWQFSQKIDYQEAETQKYISDEIKNSKNDLTEICAKIKIKINENKAKWWQIWRFGNEEQARKIRYAEWENKANLLCILKSFTDGHIKNEELIGQLNSLISKSNDQLSASIRSFLDSVKCQSYVKMNNQLGILSEPSVKTPVQYNDLNVGKAIFHKVGRQKNESELQTRRDHMLSALNQLRMF